MSAKNFKAIFKKETDGLLSEQFRTTGAYMLSIDDDAKHHDNTVSIDVYGRDIIPSSDTTPKLLKKLAKTHAVNLLISLRVVDENAREKTKMLFMSDDFQHVTTEHFLMDDPKDPETYGNEMIVEHLSYTPKITLH